MAPLSREEIGMNAFGRFALILVFGLPAVATGKVGIAADPAAGRSLARSACAYCHVVTDDQGFAPVLRPQGPDFAIIAANPKNTAKKLRTFLLTTHKNVRDSTGMPNPILKNDQIDNIVSFIMGERKKP